MHFSPRELVQCQLDSLRFPGNRRVSYVDGIPSHTAHDLLHDLDRHIEVMDEVGIDIAMISSGSAMRQDLDSCRVVNDALCQAMSAYPRRIIGMAHAPAAIGNSGLDELERAVSVLGLRGVAVPSAVGGKGLDHRDLFPFHEQVQALNRFLFIHPALSSPTLGFQGFDAYEYRTVGREFDLVLAVLRLICGGVMDAFPRLTIVVSHLGGGLSTLLGRIHNYRDKSFWGLTDDPIHGRTAKEPLDKYISRLYFDTAGHFGDLTAVQAALLNIRSSQLLFGTDYPQEMRGPAEVQHFIDGLGRLSLEDDVRSGILGGNAFRLLSDD